MVSSRIKSIKVNKEYFCDIILNEKTSFTHKSTWQKDGIATELGIIGDSFLIYYLQFLQYYLFSIK